MILVDDKTDRTNANDEDIDNSQKTIRLGLRPNINQFLILVLVNAFVGAMVGLEQILTMRKEGELLIKRQINY